jgi:hypothetical protein
MANVVTASDLIIYSSLTVYLKTLSIAQNIECHSRTINNNKLEGTWKWFNFRY